MLGVVEIDFLGIFLESFFYGLYSAIFAMYVRYQASKKNTNKMQNVIFYSICLLYVLSVVLFVSDISTPITLYLGKSMDLVLHIELIQTMLFACCDFISQFILIYRCWIVWGCNIRVVIIPSILSFAFLVIWLIAGSSMHTSSHRIITPHWAPLMLVASLALSLAVNTLVTGLIVFRILRVFREVKAATSGDQNLGATGGSKLRRTILVIIESGMALFAIQLARLVVYIVWTDGAITAFGIIFGIHEMLNGITPTIILVRTSMGLSFHDEKSMEEIAIGSLRFAADHPNSVPETGSISNIVGEDERDDDDIDVQLSNDIEIVER